MRRPRGGAGGACALSAAGVLEVVPYASVASNVFEALDIVRNLFFEGGAGGVGGVVVGDARRRQRAPYVRALRLAHPLQFVLPEDAHFGREPFAARAAEAVDVGDGEFGGATERYRVRLYCIANSKRFPRGAWVPGTRPAFFLFPAQGSRC